MASQSFGLHEEFINLPHKEMATKLISVSLCPILTTSAPRHLSGLFVLWSFTNFLTLLYLFFICSEFVHRRSLCRYSCFSDFSIVKTNSMRRPSNHNLNKLWIARKKVGLGQ